MSFERSWILKFTPATPRSPLVQDVDVRALKDTTTVEVVIRVVQCWLMPAMYHPSVSVKPLSYERYG